MPVEPPPTPVAVPRPSTSPTSTAWSASAPTSSRARSSPPTGRGCSRCRCGRDGPMAWWSPDPRGVLPLDGLARRAGRCGARARRYEVRVDTAFAEVVDGVRRPGRAGGWITADDPRRLRAAARARLGAQRRGLGRRRAWPAGSTAWPSAACSPASRCSTAGPTRRRSRWSAWSSCSRADGDGGGCSTCSGRPSTSRRSASVDVPRPRLPRAARARRSRLPLPAPWALSAVGVGGAATGWAVGARQRVDAPMRSVHSR